MTDSSGTGRVIPSERVRRETQPVIVDCRQADGDHREAMTVIPITDAGHVAGIEVRCRCGASVMIECIYEEER